MEVFGPVLGLCLAVAFGVWACDDAKKRGMDGVGARFWGMAVAVLPVVFLPFYLILRPARVEVGPTALQTANQLVQLERLKAQGTLSEEAFRQARDRLLGTDLSRAYVEETSAHINTLLQQGRKPEALAAALQLRTRLSGHSQYAKDLNNVESAIRALSGPVSVFNGARVLGGLLLVFGVLLVVSALQMDVTVAVPSQTFMGETIGGGRVNNLGLMNERQNLVTVGSVLGLGGLLLALLGGNSKR